MKTWIRTLPLLALLIVGIALPLLASADSIFDPDGNIANKLSLSQEDAESTVIRVVQYALGFVGFLAVIMVLYGGFRYLTSGGNEETVKNARALIRAAIFGLLIILFAQALLIGVVNILVKAT